MIVELVTFRATPGADWDAILADAGEAAHDAAWRAAVAQRTGSAPAIRYFELQMLLDNEAGTVTEWSKGGARSVRPAG
jgi:hypothetical protein